MSFNAFFLCNGCNFFQYIAFILIKLSELNLSAIIVGLKSKFASKFLPLQFIPSVPFGLAIIFNNILHNLSKKKKNASKFKCEFAEHNCRNVVCDISGFGVCPSLIHFYFLLKFSFIFYFLLSIDNIFVRVYERRMDLLRAVIIGTEGTPYHDGLFFFDFFFDFNYPNVPPVCDSNF